MDEDHHDDGSGCMMDQDAGKWLAQLFVHGGGGRPKLEFEVKIKNRPVWGPDV